MEKNKKNHVPNKFKALKAVRTAKTDGNSLIRMAIRRNCKRFEPIEANSRNLVLIGSNVKMMTWYTVNRAKLEMARKQYLLDKESKRFKK